MQNVILHTTETDWKLISIPFSDTTNKNGIIQLIERNLGMVDGTISNDATALSSFTADVNLALDYIWAMILNSSGTWNLDDSNQTDWPFIVTNLVSGQRDYPFTTDGSGNVILEIFRVMVSDPNGTFSEIYPVDQQTPTQRTGNLDDTKAFINGLNATGTPIRYDKTGNGIFLDPIPNYAITGGLKVFIDREATHFVSSDTNKKAGFAGIFHEYLALRPAYQYAYRRGLSNVKFLQLEVSNMERACEDYYSKRDRDVRRRLIANVENMR